MRYALSKNLDVLKVCNYYGLFSSIITFIILIVASVVTGVISYKEYEKKDIEKKDIEKYKNFRNISLGTFILSTLFILFIALRILYYKNGPDNHWLVETFVKISCISEIFS